MEKIQEQIEDKIIDSINSGVLGRLITFKPEKNAFGADLAVERRGKYKEKEIYFQVNVYVAPAEAKIFTKDFFQESFKADKNFYLLFVCFDEVKQKVNDYIWLIPSLQFREIAEVVKSKDNKKLFRFKASLDIKNKNDYSKFLVNTKELGKVILSALSARGGSALGGEKSGSSGNPFEEKLSVNLERLKEFLAEARQNTYASDSSPIDNPRLLASKQLEFQKGEYSYRDIYFSGEKRFIGQEIVYQGSKPIWGMNYIGSQIGKMETAFLKESLFQLSEKCRFGETCEYEKRDFKYQDKGQGNLDEFSGKEEILSKNKSIYKLNYQGGLILDKL
jgi:hypothetical protein